MPYFFSILLPRDAMISDTAYQHQTRPLKTTNANSVFATMIATVRARGRSRTIARRMFRAGGGLVDGLKLCRRPHARAIAFHGRPLRSSDHLPPARRSDLIFEPERVGRSEEHTSELQSRFGISYAVF